MALHLAIYSDDVDRALEQQMKKLLVKSLEAKVTIASNDKFNASEFLNFI